MGHEAPGEDLIVELVGKGGCLLVPEVLQEVGYIGRINL